MQWMHSGRRSQCYINITRNTFIAKTSRGCNVSSKNKGKQAKGEYIIKKKKQLKKKYIYIYIYIYIYTTKKKTAKPRLESNMATLPRLTLSGKINIIMLKCIFL